MAGLSLGQVHMQTMEMCTSESIPQKLALLFNLHTCFPIYAPLMYATNFCMQTFWKRVQNYIQNVVVNILVMPPVRADQHNFVKKTGHSFRTYETGISTSAAVIANGDWALEFPMPMPPKLHVRN